MLIASILVVVTLCLAWSNGANDNFKGVATLYGSATASYRSALTWATIATLAGSLVSVIVAHGLVKAFSGSGILDTPSFEPAMLTAVGLGAAVTIMLATVIGMPTSTTHALTGALVGVGLVAAPGSIQWNVLATKFAQPLLLSPFLAIGITAIVYPLLRKLRQRTGVTSETCLCVGSAAPQPVVLLGEGMAAMTSHDGEKLTVEIGEKDRCVERYAGDWLGIDAQRSVNALHWLSGGAVCFARGVNDAPKIAALLLASGIATTTTHNTGILLLVTAAMVVGGLIQSRKVAETMSKNITDLNTGQGLTANLVTAALVLGASRLGVPVSTTHVSCGTIFGISAVNGKRNWSTIAGILTTWITTLPLGLALGAAAYWVLRP